MPTFEVRHGGVRATGDASIGTQALYPCDDVTCDCAGNCNYLISEYDGTYEVTVYVASAYGERVVTPQLRTVTVAGSDVNGQDFEVD